MIDLVRSAVRLLTFRSTRRELLELGPRHLAFGLVCTWLVGIGRYWDDPRAHLLQHLGLGSLVYVFVLSLLLFLLIWPLDPPDWSFRRLLAFVALVSPPAALYAVPVERFMSLEAANATNAWFLACVALWRVLLLFFYLARYARLGFGKTLVAGLLPLTAIVTILFLLNLEQAAFSLMGGIRNPTAGDAAYDILFLLTAISSLAVGPLLLGYLIFVVLAQRERLRRLRKRDNRPKHAA